MEIPSVRRASLRASRACRLRRRLGTENPRESSCCGSNISFGKPSPRDAPVMFRAQLRTGSVADPRPCSIVADSMWERPPGRDLPPQWPIPEEIWAAVEKFRCREDSGRMLSSAGVSPVLLDAEERRQPERPPYKARQQRQARLFAGGIGGTRFVASAGSGLGHAEAWPL
jgi:hypothetical protein